MAKVHKLLILGLILVVVALLDATLYYFAENAAGYNPTFLDALGAKLPVWGTSFLLLPFIYITARTFLRRSDNLPIAIPIAVFWIVVIAFLKVLLGSAYFQTIRTGISSLEQALATFSKHLALHYFSSLTVTALLLSACVYIVREKRNQPDKASADSQPDQWEAAKDAAWQTADRVLIKSPNRSVFVKVEDIEWIESAGNYVTIHTNDKEYLLRKSMRQMETLLDGKTFFRAHRTTIVNLAKIKEIRQLEGEQHAVFLNDGEELKISRANIEKLETLLSIESRS